MYIAPNVHRSSSDQPKQTEDTLMKDNGIEDICLNKTWDKLQANINAIIRLGRIVLSIILYWVFLYPF